MRWMGATGKSWSSAQESGIDWNTREVRDVLRDQALAQELELLGDVPFLRGEGQRLLSDPLHQSLREGPVAERQVAEVEVPEEDVAHLLGIVEVLPVVLPGHPLVDLAGVPCTLSWASSGTSTSPFSGPRSSAR